MPFSLSESSLAADEPTCQRVKMSFNWIRVCVCVSVCVLCERVCTWQWIHICVCKFMRLCLNSVGHNWLVPLWRSSLFELCATILSMTIAFSYFDGKPHWNAGDDVWSLETVLCPFEDSGGLEPGN